MRKLSSVLIVLISVMVIMNITIKNNKYTGLVVSKSFLVPKNVSPEVKKIMDFFVEKEYKGKKLFKYERDLRPVYVIETDLLPEGDIGAALPFLNVCVIFLKKEYVKNAAEDKVLTLFIHEYLHCMFYAHSVDIRDVMYYRTNPHQDINTMFRYFDDMVRKYD